jgi:2-haloalkanoic acid dehalogenase type II
MKLTDFTVLTFDCYGTLIDWEAGIARALGPLSVKASPPIAREQALAAFAQHESAQQQQTPAMLYSQLLSVVYQRLASHWNVPVSQQQCESFAASIADWPPFPDTVEALLYLKRHYKLVILSNVDRTSFQATNARLEVAFDAIYTAQDIGSYKPSPRNFDYLLRRLHDDFGIHTKQVLHVAQSLFHDHAPAQQAGLASAWIDRRHARDGWGATVPPAGPVKYDFRFESLAALVSAHRQELR